MVLVEVISLVNVKKAGRVLGARSELARMTAVAMANVTTVYVLVPIPLPEKFVTSHLPLAKILCVPLRVPASPVNAFARTDSSERTANSLALIC